LVNPTSYGVAKRRLLPEVEHRQSRFLNNRAENWHRPARRRERQMQRFKSLEQAQTLLSAHAFIHGHFHPRGHLLTADAYRAIRSIGFDVWHRETCARYTAWPALRSRPGSPLVSLKLP
jgi:putative transposase